MNEIFKAITERYSCRNFASTPLSEQQIGALVDAALAAPSAKNLQPWQIIVVTDKALIDEVDAEGISVLSQGIESNPGYELVMSNGGKMFYGAPCLIVIALDNSAHMGRVDCGIVAQNICLTAYSLGLGSLMCGMVRATFNGPRGQEFKERLKFPPGYEFGVSVLVGTATASKSPHKPDKSKVTYL